MSNNEYTMSADEAYDLLSDQSMWESFHDGDMADEDYDRFTTAIEMAKEALHTQTVEGLNTALYQKMFASQEEYKNGLMLQPCERVLESAYEYVKREDILASLEYNDLERREVEALLALPDPLATVFDWYENHLNNTCGTDVDRMWSAIEDCAASLLDN